MKYDREWRRPLIWQTKKIDPITEPKSVVIEFKKVEKDQKVGSSQPILIAA